MATYQIKLVLRPELVIRISSYPKRKVTHCAQDCTTASIASDRANNTSSQASTADETPEKAGMLKTTMKQKMKIIKQIILSVRVQIRKMKVTVT